MSKPEIKISKTTDFENWVLMRYTGKVMDKPPEDFDEKNEFYHYHKGKQFGPINKLDIPKEFLC